jgi:hypothetical protein
MADYRGNTDSVGLRPRFFNRSGTTEPDLVLIKQVEQVTTFVLEGPPRPLPGFADRDHRRSRSPRISDLATTALAVTWLQKQPGSVEGDLFAKGQSGNAAGSNRRFHEPGQLGSRAGALPNSVRLIHNLGNLACCPGFKMSHHLPPTCRARRRSSS